MIQKTLCFVALFVLQIIGSCKGSAVARNSSSIQSRVGLSYSEWAKVVSYQASLRLRQFQVENRGTRGFLCGASLISDNVVLTSAECAQTGGIYLNHLKPEELLVVMGSYYLVDNNENTLDFGVKSVKTGNFKNSTYDHDIALLFLDGKVPANHPIIKPVTLNDGSLQDGFMCRAFGWGYHFRTTLVQDYLLYVDLPLLTSKGCSEQTARKAAIHDGMICAGRLDSYYSNADTCQYDKGGPLECRGILTGIISWGNDCGEAIHPTVLTNVAMYKGWIIKQVALRGGTQPSFGKV